MYLLSREFFSCKRMTKRSSSRLMHVLHPSNGSTAQRLNGSTAQLAAGAQISAISSISPTAATFGGGFRASVPPLKEPLSTWERYRSSGERQRSSSESQRSGLESQRSGLESQRSSSECQHSSSESQRSSSESQRSGLECQRSSLPRTPFPLKATRTTSHLTR